MIPKKSCTNLKFHVVRMVHFREDLFIQNDENKRKFDKTCVVFPLVETSLMNQSISREEYKFDSYEKGGGCYIKDSSGFHSFVNECDLYEVVPCPCKKKKTEPCHEKCACINIVSSIACDKCPRQGSYEQRIEMMRKLNEGIS